MNSCPGTLSNSPETAYALIYFPLTRDLRKNDIASQLEMRGIRKSEIGGL
jgi:hypothetical protein